jgi:hypothetical protein
MCGSSNEEAKDESKSISELNDESEVFALEVMITLNYNI